MALTSKILELSQLQTTITRLREAGSRIVHCHGVFDLLHIGHIRHFEQARKFGDVLVVTITADPFVRKGPFRPAFPQHLRAETLAALGVVDFVAINDSPSAELAIRAIRPHVFVRGPDYRQRPTEAQGNQAKEDAAVREVGAEVTFTDDVVFSSSNLINTYFPQFPDDVVQYLRDLRSRHPISTLTDLLDRMRALKVLVVGESIIDRYHYCQAIGKAGKEPVLVARSHSEESFAGGVLAIANHVAGFCDNVGLISTLGADNASHEFARKSLLPNVAATFLSQSQRPTITKLRYVEQYNLQKLFELYSIVDDPLEADDDAALCATLLNEVPKYDLVIVADYGHGMISSKAIRVLCDNAKFLAVNTQANAGNRGFHTISRYPRADYISLSELELNLEMKTRDVVAQELIAELKKKMEFGRITVTRGKNGILTYDHALGFAEGPGLAQKVVDRIGSGDAVLSVTSPIAFLGASPELIAFIGNVVGSEAVAIVGHRTTLEANSIRRVISSLLK